MINNYITSNDEVDKDADPAMHFRNRDEEPEWMPYCMAILCNLASRSKSVCQRIKKSVAFLFFLFFVFHFSYFWYTLYIKICYKPMG